MLFTSVMHVHDDCSTVHASISWKKIVLHFKYIFALHACSGPIAYFNAGYACIFFSHFFVIKVLKELFRVDLTFYCNPFFIIHF
ncbi:hypothetical protein FKM82_026159 [Ascaphus truei]